MSTRSIVVVSLGACENRAGRRRPPAVDRMAMRRMRTGSIASEAVALRSGYSDLAQAERSVALEEPYSVNVGVLPIETAGVRAGGRREKRMGRG